MKGDIELDGEDIYARGVDPVAVRRLIGMVFQQPNPFPTMSIYDNVAAGLNFNSGKVSKSDKDAIVERSLRGAHLWDEVKDRLDRPGSSLSGGQQQRLCIARATAVSPEVLLMDEPCSALDPVATLAIEDLIGELKKEYTIAIVTHNMQQAARASDNTAFFNLEESGKPGRLIEIGPTQEIFTKPTRRRPRTTSPVASARSRSGRGATMPDIRVEYQEELQTLEASALGGLDLVGGGGGGGGRRGGGDSGGGEERGGGRRGGVRGGRREGGGGGGEGEGGERGGGGGGQGGGRR